MSEFENKFNERQIGLLKGTIQPETSEEWDWIQKHASAILSEESDKNRVYEATTVRPFKIVEVGKPLSLKKPKPRETNPDWLEREK